jgi:PhnO protein
VRSAEIDDSERIADLTLQLGYPCTAEQVRMRLAEMEDSEHYAVYVAQLPGGIVAGWIGICIFCAVEVDRCAEITGLVVDKQVRSRGIGQLLLDVAEKWASTHGCRVVAVRSNVTRERAHRFYTKNAYEHIKTQQVFRKVL